MAARLEKYPFIRFVIPFVAGILCGEACPVEWAVYVPVLIGMSLALLCFFYRSGCFFGMALFFFLFFSGSQCLFLQKRKTCVSWTGEKELYKGIITDTPQEKPRSFLCPVELNKHKVLLYLAKDSLSGKLRRGDWILFYTSVSVPEQRVIPGQFDYARYLRHQGIAGTAYVPEGFWRRMETEPRAFSLKQEALNLRDRLLERYGNLGFHGDEWAVLSALTLGDKSELKESLKETYSVTGASHVLALSGLHLGILYGICAFVLSFLRLGRFTGWVRMGCLVTVLWSFSFMVGLSASVVRSACMFSLFAIATCLNRKSLSWNTLALSAFLMLLYQPYYLFDVGFQLSYTAVAFIVWLHPKVSAWWKPSSRILRYIWGILSVSLVAQLGVAPLIMYYFSHFSVYFLLTNLLVIPLTFCIVAGTLLMWGCSFYPPLQRGVATVLNESIKGMHVGLGWIERLPYSAIDQIKIEVWGIAGFYLFLFFLVGYLLYRKAKYLTGMLAVAACSMVLCALPLFEEKPARLLFYHSVQGASVQCAYAGKEPFELFSVERESGIQRFGGKTIALLKDDGWLDCSAGFVLPLDYLFIQRGFTGNIMDLQELFVIHHIVLDTSLSMWQRKRLREESERLGIKVFTLSEKGYLWVEV